MGRKVDELNLAQNGTPSRNRTCDQQLRRLLLYPLSYRGVGYNFIV